MNTFNFIINNILSQSFEDLEKQVVFYLMTYWSRTMSLTEQNYDMSDAEMLVIVESCAQW